MNGLKSNHIHNVIYKNKINKINKTNTSNNTNTTNNFTNYLNPIYNKLNLIFTKNNNKTILFFPNQSNEVEVGNREYKINLDYSDKKPKILNNILNKKASQMKYRIAEGNGKAIYFIGLEDNGNAIGIEFSKLIISLYYLSEIVKLSNSSFSKIRIYFGKMGFIATIRVTQQIEKHFSLDF